MKKKNKLLNLKESKLTLDMIPKRPNKLKFWKNQEEMNEIRLC